MFGQLISLEALLSLPQGEVVDATTNQKRPIPPKIVTDRDEWEIDNLPFLPDRQHHSAQWMMWHVLGLPRILERLFAGGEYSAKDPELIKLAELAYSYRDNIKSVLGFWIPDNSSPTWLLGMFLGKLGLKTTSRKKGAAGQQVKFYSLAVEECIFAVQVLEYRHEQRLKREEKKRQREESNRLHKMMMETQYGITDNSISTPTENKDISELQGGVNIDEDSTSRLLEKAKAILPVLIELENTGRIIVRELFLPTRKLRLIQKALVRYLNNPMKLFLQLSGLLI